MILENINGDTNIHGKWIILDSDLWKKEYKNKTGIEWDDRERSGQPTICPTCSYCGSISPEMFWEAVVKGYKIGGSDWKYGWPHKFYVDYPNPEPDKLYINCSTSTGSKPIYNERGTLDRYKKIQDDPPKYTSEWNDHYGWVGRGRYPVLHMKFYTDHLADGEFTFDQFNLIKERTGIKFNIDDKGKLFYSAPYHGYQI